MQWLLQETLTSALNYKPWCKHTHTQIYIGIGFTCLTLIVQSDVFLQKPQCPCNPCVASIYALSIALIGGDKNYKNTSNKIKKKLVTNIHL